MRHLQTSRRYLVFLLCIVMALQVACFPSCKSKTSNDNPHKDNASSKEENTLLDEVNNQTDQNNGNATDKCLVRFLTDEGVPISIVECSKGDALIPPTPPRQIGYVFTGWDGDYSYIHHDVDIIATYVDVSQTTNAISADTIYTISGSEFSVIVGIYGDVSFCGLDMDISYDTDLLELIEATDVDDCVILNNATEGVIHMNFVTTSNTVGEVSFMTLNFKSKTGTTAETDLHMQVKSMYELGNDDALNQAEYQVLPNKIIIDEVYDET